MRALRAGWWGGSWGRPLARRAGQAQGHAAFRLTEADRTVGSTPTPPPSRRRDHLLSLPWVIAGLALAAFLLPRTYLRAVAPGVQTGPLLVAAVLVSLLALAAAGASTARSTLGARVIGPVLVLAAVPALSNGMIPGGHLVSRLLPHGPNAVVLAAIGIELMAIGWGAHVARRQGRANALATAGPYLAWTAWQNARTPAGYIPAISGLSTASVDENGLRYVLPSILDAYGLTDPRTDFYFQPGIKSGTTFLWADLLYVFYSLLPVVALIGLWHSRQRRAVALATGGGPAVAAGIVQARELATSASYFRTVSGRYAVSIAALYCAAASLIADRPRWRWGLVGFAVAGYLLLMLGVVGASSLEEVNEDLRR